MLMGYGSKLENYTLIQEVMNLTKSEEERKPQHNSIIVTYEIGCLYEGDILHLK